MKTLKRISATINAQINTLVDQIEDHEAVANVALQDIRDSLMQAKYQIRRVQNEQQILEQRITEKKSDEQKWTERALVSKETNPERALECVRRLKRTQDEMKSLEQQRSENERLEEKLTDDVRKIETRFEELKRKKNWLAARESRADAMKVLAQNPGSNDLQTVFERWEQKVIRTEVVGESLEITEEDSLDLEFSKNEERVELELMLKELERKNQ